MRAHEKEKEHGGAHATQPRLLRLFSDAARARRLSRADMGDAVAALRGHPRANVRRVPSASVSRPVASPADISMDSALAQTELGLTPTPFAEAVRRAFKL